MSTIILFMGMILKMSKPVELGWHTATDVMLWLVILLLVPVVLYFLSRKSSNGLDKEIFEERNTEFGAYNIRKNLPRNLGIGFLVGFVLLSFVLLQLGMSSTSKQAPKKEVKKTKTVSLQKKAEKPKEKPKPKKPKLKKKLNKPKQELTQKRIEPTPKENPDSTKLHKVEKMNPLAAAGTSNGGTVGGGSGGTDSTETGNGGDDGPKEPILTDEPTDLPEFANGGEDGIQTVITLCSEADLAQTSTPGVHVVILDFIVELDGSTSGVKLAPGFEPLDMNIAKIIMKCFIKNTKADAFVPGTKDGQDVRVHMLQEIVINIE